MNDKKITTISKDYFILLKEIKDKIIKARITAYKNLNKELINLYWDIGKSIVEKQKKYGWGKSIVEKLSNDLRKEFPGIKGYSAQNLWYMRQFYLEYREYPNLQQVVGEIPWGQNLVILHNKLPTQKDIEKVLKE